jgi:translocator protein
MLKTWYSLGMLLFLILLCLAVGQLGVFFTTEHAYSWYNALAKPEWTPPNIVFPLVWTILYVIMAFAAWLVWCDKTPGYRNALIFWGAQLLLNAMWTPLFFGQQAILYGLVVIDILWILLLITTVLFYRHSKIAAFLMFIYFLWISFAGILNLMIWQMNS